MLASRILVLVALLGCARLGAAQVPFPPEKSNLPSIGQTNSPLLTFTKTLETISKEHNVSIICDAYAGEDVASVGNEWKGLPVAEAIQTIARIREREVTVIDGIYVLRHKRWAGILVDMARGDYPNQWKNGGTVVVTVPDNPTSAEFVLPAPKVTVAASEVSCARLATELQKVANWNVRTSPEIGSRRLSVYAKDAAPGAILQGVAFLLNAGPEVVLRPSKDQLAMEDDASILLPDYLKKRVRPSEKLRAELEKGLTDQQRQALENGEFVAIPISAMPKSLQKEALDYITLSAKLNSNTIQPPDMSRQESFQIRFRPMQSGSLWRMLGVVTMGSDGTEYYY